MANTWLLMLILLLPRQPSSPPHQCPSHRPPHPRPTHPLLVTMNPWTRRWRLRTTSCPKRSFCAGTRSVRLFYVLCFGTVFKALASHSMISLNLIIIHLSRLQGPVAVKVQVPNMQDKTEWKLSGQVLNFTVPLTDQVLCLLLTVHTLCLKLEYIVLTWIMYSLGICYQSQNPRGHRHGCWKTEVTVRGNSSFYSLNIYSLISKVAID